MSLGKARFGSGSSPSGWSPPWNITGFSSLGEQGTLRRGLLHFRKASAFTPANTLPPGLALPTPKRARQKRSMGAGSLRPPPLPVLLLGLSASGTPSREAPRIHPPAPAGGPRRLHVPGELLTPRPTPALRPGPRVPAPRRRLTGPRVREGGAEALSQLHGVRRARQLSAASSRGRRRHCGTTGGSARKPAAARGHRPGREEGGRRPEPTPRQPAPASPPPGAGAPSRAEQSGARRGRSFPRMGLTGKHGSSLFLEE